jgi:hypothetical protein
MYPAMAYHIIRSRAYKKVPFDEISIELDTMESNTDVTIKHDNSCSIEMVCLNHISNDVILHFAITSIVIKCNNTNLVFHQSHIESSKPIVAIINDTELQICNDIQSGFGTIYLPFPKTNDDITFHVLGNNIHIKFVDGLLDHKNIGVKTTYKINFDIGNSIPKSLLYDIFLNQ